MAHTSMAWNVENCPIPAVGYGTALLEQRDTNAHEPLDTDFMFWAGEIWCIVHSQSAIKVICVESRRV